MSGPGERRPGRGEERELAVAEPTTVTRSAPKLARPPPYKVLLHNDDFTPMEFVVTILETHFQKSESDALAIMLHAHTKGFAVAGVFSFEIAEMKVHKVDEASREAGFPLLCTLEPESDGNGETD